MEDKKKLNKLSEVLHAMPEWKMVPDEVESGYQRLEALNDFVIEGIIVKKGEKSGLISKSATIGQYSWVTADSVVGDNCIIGEHTLIAKDSSVTDSSAVPSHAVIEESSITHSTIRSARNFNTLSIHRSGMEGTVALCNSLEIRNSSIRQCYITSGDVLISHGELRSTTISPITSTYLKIEHAQLYDTFVGSETDFMVFKNWWSSKRWFTYSRYTNLWKVGCFYGTGQELIKKAYKDSPISGREYERIVNMVDESRKDFVLRQNEYMKNGVPEHRPCDIEMDEGHTCNDAPGIYCPEDACCPEEARPQGAYTQVER